MKQIPNLFTLLNLVFGCMAIIFILKYEPNNGFNLSGISLLMGSICIFLAAVVDFLDGFVARLFKATSEMGAQLDSLADAVSFGVAPSMILFKLLGISFNKNTAYSGEIIWVQLPAFMFACAAVWRLAKFNLDEDQAYYFKGLPTPAAGLVIASLSFSPRNASFIISSPFLIYTVIILMSYLMVSNIPLISLKFKSKGFKNNIDKIILIAAALVSILLLQLSAAPVILMAYVILSLVFKPDKTPA